ncbi:MAG: hypothetical protein U1F83_13690 [Verrucomicrobiota bacterium]
MKKTNVSTLMATFRRYHPWDHTSLHSPSLKLGVAALSVAALMLASKADAGNILVNPGFETGAAGWTVYTPQGAGGNVFETQNPTHGGVNVYKNWGCWCADTNLNSVLQDNPSGVGATYNASGYARSGNNGDTIGGLNEAWLEVDFLDIGGAIIARYDSQHLDSSASTTDWTYCAITNKMHPVYGTNIGTVASLTAPAGAKTVRFYAKYLQVLGGGGSAQFDDMSLDQISGNLPPTIANLAPNGTSIFNPAAAGITFNGTSTTTNLYTSGVQLILNGLDVSGGLVVTGSGTANIGVSYPSLAANRLYTAVINLTDGAGFTVTKSIIFDTFATANFVWEAEDYDYNGGSFFNNPTNTSYLAANSYFGRPGTPDVDWHESGGWGGNNAQAYREAGVGPGVEWASDAPRQKIVDAQALDPDVHDYDVGWVSGLSGDWMNYTRTIPAGSYNIYCRLASGSGGNQRCQVGSTTTPYGVATIVGGAGWQAWQWAPVLDAGGNLVKLDYATATTVTYRVSADGCNMNFFMLAPARTDLPLIANLYPTGTKPFEPANALTFNAQSSVATIAPGDIHVTLNGNNVDALLTIGSNNTNRTVSLPYLASNAIYSATISVKDSAGTTVSRTANFDTFNESNFSFEAEDYNFGDGQFIASPVLSTGPAADNYFQQSIAADPGVDISTIPPASGYNVQYGRPDSVGTEVASDYLRQAYVTARLADAGVNDYDVGWDNSGTWFNYTRNIPAGNYVVYARLAGPTVLNGTMDLVAGATTASQTLTPLGNFAGYSSGWQSWVWVPLIGPSGPTVVSGGTKTFRYTTLGGNNQGYFMLAPAKNVVALTASATGGHKVSIPTQAGATYTLYYKNSLSDANWTYLTIVAGNGTTKTYTDTSATGNQRFYRAVIQ